MSGETLGTRPASAVDPRSDGGLLRLPRPRLLKWTGHSMVKAEVISSSPCACSVLPAPRPIPPDRALGPARLGLRHNRRAGPSTGLHGLARFPAAHPTSAPMP